jgi:dehydrogenase/reductase SDR family protein 7B
MYFKDKVVWLTGASSGVGEATAYAFNNEKAQLILSSNDEEELKRVRDNCNYERDKIMLLPFNLTDHLMIPELAKKVFERFGKIDILFNIGGVSQRSLAKETSLDIDKRIMDINYFGAVALTKAVLPFMIKNKSGHIAAMSSLAGKFGIPLRSAYAASKHALHGFFDTLREEVYQDNIHITLFCPAYIRTNIALNALSKDGTPQNENAPRAEKGTPPDKFAQLALKSIRKKKREVVSGGSESMGVYVKKFSPKLLSRIMRKRDVR